MYNKRMFKKRPYRKVRIPSLFMRRPNKKKVREWIAHLDETKKASIDVGERMTFRKSEGATLPGFIDDEYELIHEHPPDILHGVDFNEKPPRKVHFDREGNMTF